VKLEKAVGTNEKLERFKLQSLNLESLHECWKEPSDVGKIHESSKVLVDVGELKLESCDSQLVNEVEKLKIKNMGHDSWREYTILKLKVNDHFAKSIRSLG